MKKINWKENFAISGVCAMACFSIACLTDLVISLFVD